MKHWASESAPLQDDQLNLLEQLDAVFVSWARRLGGTLQQYSPLLSAADLNRGDHFASFPHQVMMVATANADDSNLQRFADAPISQAGTINLPELNPVSCCLTPGACYPVYINRQGQTVPKREIISVRSTCFRSELEEVPLRRQSAFTMREIVCMGSANEVHTFLSQCQAQLTEWISHLGLSVTSEQATDPFFNPGKNAKYVMQRLSPLKQELVWNSDLAIGSINYHKTGFGQAFNIDCEDQPMHSGCVAFGLERWVYVWLKQFGPALENWPALDDAEKLLRNHDE